MNQSSFLKDIGGWASGLRKAARPYSTRSGSPLHTAVEYAARVGYGARGFVYVSLGVITLLAALDIGGRAVGTHGAVVWLAGQPFGRVWLVALGLGLWAFVAWRVLQAIFDADREGR